MTRWSEARVLVTGSSGFVGRHLVEHLRVGGIGALVGTGRRGSTDLRDAHATRRFIAARRPTCVFHLAGVLPSPGVDWTALYEGNVLASINLFDALRESAPDAFVVMASSSAVYGWAPDGGPIAEDTEFRPISLYGVSKAAQELVAIQHVAARGARIVRARIFNLLGAGQSPTLVVSELAQDIAIAERTSRSVISVGNLDAERDYLDVRDAVRAMALLAEHGAPSGAFNIASGVARSVRQCVNGLIAMASHPITAVPTEARQRSVDIPRQVGDSGSLRKTVNWCPEISFEASLREVLDYWRAQTDEGRRS